EARAGRVAPGRHPRRPGDPGELGRDPAPDEGSRSGLGPGLAERLHGQPGAARAGGNRRRHPHHGCGGLHSRQRRSGRAADRAVARMAARSPTDPPSRWTDGVRREVLANGLTLLVQPDHSAPVVAVVTHVKAGFFDEPDRWTGISHVLEHMFFKGTHRRGVGAIARETKAAGGYLNAGTGYDHTSYFTVLPASNLTTALAIQADAMRDSIIDQDELARELQVIIQDAKRKLDTTG